MQDIQKICAICGEDCSDRPRIKDPKGRYHCKACYDDAVARRHRRTNHDESRSEPAAAAPVARMLEESTLVETCPGCSESLSANEVVCHHCGYHRGRHEQITTHTDADAPAAVPTTLPPFRQTGRGEAAEKAARDIARQAYLTPLFLLLFGGAGIFVVQWLMTGVPISGAIYLMTFLVSVPIGLIVFWVCCLLWIGFDAPLHLTALRLAGIYAVADLAMHVPFIGWLLSAAVYISLLMSILELDAVDAVAVAIATFLVKLVLFIALVAWLTTQMMG